jgi:hypothetical protein
VTYHEEGSGDALFLQVCEEGDHLHRLTEAHLIRENTVQTIIVETHLRKKEKETGEGRREKEGRKKEREGRRRRLNEEAADGRRRQDELGDMPFTQPHCTPHNTPCFSHTM